MFDAQKSAQAAAFLLWGAGGRLPSVKLMGLLYLAEKQFLLQCGERLTGDRMVCLPQGPAMSAASACLANGSEDWDAWITRSGSSERALKSTVYVDSKEPLATFDALSVAEASVLDAVYDAFAGVSQGKRLRDSRYCPEWEETNGARRPIGIEVLLVKNGRTRGEAEAILEKIREVEELQRIAQRLP